MTKECPCGLVRSTCEYHAEPEVSAAETPTCTREQILKFMKLLADSAYDSLQGEFTYKNSWIVKRDRDGQ